MSSRKRLCVLTIALVTIGQSGCLMLGATAAGGGVLGLAYLAGKATHIVDASLDETSMAVGTSLRDLGLPLDDSHGTTSHAEIVGRLANGEPLHVDLDQEPRAFGTDPPRTRIGMRIAAFGDEKLSKRILEQIDYRLKNPAPQPPPTSPPPPQKSLDSEEPPVAK